MVGDLIFLQSWTSTRSSVPSSRFSCSLTGRILLPKISPWNVYISPQHYYIHIIIYIYIAPETSLIPNWHWDKSCGTFDTSLLLSTCKMNLVKWCKRHFLTDVCWNYMCKMRENIVFCSGQCCDGSTSISGQLENFGLPEEGEKRKKEKNSVFFYQGL